MGLRRVISDGAWTSERSRRSETVQDSELAELNVSGIVLEALSKNETEQFGASLRRLAAPLKH